MSSHWAQGVAAAEIARWRDRAEVAERERDEYKRRLDALAVALGELLDRWLWRRGPEDIDNDFVREFLIRRGLLEETEDACAFDDMIAAGRPWYAVTDAGGAALVAFGSTHWPPR